MQPNLLKPRKKKEQKLYAWFRGVGKTGVVRTSVIPDLSNATLLAAQDQVVIDTVEFDAAVSKKTWLGLQKAACVQLNKKIDRVDLAQAHIDSEVLQEMLSWFTREQVEIRQLNLAKVSSSERAWRCVVQWLFASGCKVQSIDLGKTKMSLARVQDLLKILHTEQLQLSRLDLGASQWCCDSVKAFLWMGGLSKSPALQRLAYGDVKISKNGMRLLCEHLAQPSNNISVLSTGVAEVPETALAILLAYMEAEQCRLSSVVLSNQLFDAGASKSVARVINMQKNIKNLALMNCWFDQEVLTSTLKSAGIENIYLEAMTAGQIQRLCDLFIANGYEVVQQITRHRVRLRKTALAHKKQGE